MRAKNGEAGVLGMSENKVNKIFLWCKLPLKFMLWSCNTTPEVTDSAAWTSFQKQVF